MVGNTIKFISIDGHGGSGKSSLAKGLARHNGADIIHIDDFTGLDATTDWHKLLVDGVIVPSLAGSSTLSYARAKWWEGHKPAPVVNQPITNVMIIEGVCSSRSELRKYMTLKIFVDTPREVCVKRGLARDRGMGGKSDDNILAQWKQWLEWDDAYFKKDNPKSMADIIVDGTQNIDDCVKVVTSLIDQMF